MCRVYCCTYWDPEDIELIVAFTCDESCQNSAFACIDTSDADFTKVILTLERDFRKDHVKLHNIRQEPGNWHYIIDGDIRLQFLKIRRIVRQYAE